MSMESAPLVVAGKRFDPVEIDPKIHPRMSPPAESGNGGATHKRWIKPEMAPVIEPNIRVTVQAAGNGSGIDAIQLMLRTLWRSMRRRTCWPSVLMLPALR